jgi:hypothetical protein
VNSAPNLGRERFDRLRRGENHAMHADYHELREAINAVFCQCLLRYTSITLTLGGHTIPLTFCTAAANRVRAGSVVTKGTAMLRHAAILAAESTACFVFAYADLKHLHQSGAAAARIFEVQHAAVAYGTMLGQ